MRHHQKAASCSAIPSFPSFTSTSSKHSSPGYTTSNKPPIMNLQKQQPPLQQLLNKESLSQASMTQSSSSSSSSSPSQIFPIPSFCLYSKQALADEYAPESDIVQFLHPVSDVLEECLPMFVGVLQSMFTIVNDMPFMNNDQDEEEDEEEEEDDDWTINCCHDDDSSNTTMIKDDKNSSPFTIIGLNTMKLVIWNNMFDRTMIDAKVFENDLCLVIFVSFHLSDSAILKNMESLKKSMTLDVPPGNITVDQLGEQLNTLIKESFDNDNY